MALSKGTEQEAALLERAYALDLSQVSSFVSELIDAPDLDVVVFYLRLYELYNQDPGHTSLQSSVLYEILCELGEKPSFTKSQTISRAAERHSSFNGRN